MSRQSPVTLQISIIQGHEEELEQVLKNSGNPSKANAAFPYQNFKEIHFARWFIVPGTILRGKKIPASVMYTANVDGSAFAHLWALVDQAPKALDDILSHCQDYPQKSDRTSESRMAFIRAHYLKTQAFYIGAPKRTVAQIHNEATLQEEVRKFFKNVQGAAGLSPQAAYDKIRQHLSGNDKWEWAIKNQFRLPGIKWVRGFFFGLLVLVALIPLILVIILIHFLYENRLQPLGLNVNQLDPERLTNLKNQEDIIYQNQLTQVFEMKPGLRKIFLRFILWFTNQLANIAEVKGSLLGTPTIHFARWVIIDQGQRFIFLSNFDGSYDEYLGDFIDNGGWGLNAVYSNAKGYPRTKFVFWGGSYKIGQFLAWGRYTQVHTQTWYSAYPNFGLPQIISRSKLRVGLFGRRNMTSKKLQDVLRRI